MIPCATHEWKFNADASSTIPLNDYCTGCSSVRAHVCGPHCAKYAHKVVQRVETKLRDEPDVLVGLTAGAKVVAFVVSGIAWSMYLYFVPMRFIPWIMGDESAWRVSFASIAAALVVGAVSSRMVDTIRNPNQKK